MGQTDVQVGKVSGQENVKDISSGNEKVKNYRGVTWSIGRTEVLLAIVIQALAAITLELHSVYLTARSPTI
jgi:hypothetical protein